VGGKVVKVLILVELPDVLVMMVTLFLGTPVTFIFFVYTFATFIFPDHEDLPNQSDQ